MAINEILTFAELGGANVIDQTTYSGSTIRGQGHAAGTALSNYMNKTWRQSAFVAHMIAQFTANGSGNDVLDNSDDAGFLANFYLALTAFIEGVLKDANYADDTSSNGNIITIAISETLTSLPQLIGQPITIRKGNQNTAGVNVVVNGLAATPLVFPDGEVMIGAELPAFGLLTVMYDGFNFILLSNPQTIARHFVHAGDPNGSVAGNAGTGSIPPDLVWDTTNKKWWTCTTTGSAVVAVWVTGLGGNTIVLSADADFYVSPSGNDTTGKGTLAAPWLTIGHAISYITANVIAGFHYVNLHLSAGTYSVSGTNGAIINVPGGNWNVIGAGSGSTTIHASGANFSCIGTVSSTAGVSVSAVTLQSDNGYGVKADGGGTIFVNSDVTLAGCGLAHIDASQGATVAINSSYEVTGNATYHWAMDNGRIVCGPGVNISSPGAIAYTNFAFLSDLAFLSCSTVTFSGFTGIGSQHNASANSVIQTQGKTEATFFPGTASSGSRTTGAQWL